EHEGEGDDHLQHHDADDAPVDVPAEERVEGEEVHARSTRTSVTGWVASTSWPTAGPGWLTGTAAAPRGTPGSGTAGSCTAPEAAVSVTGAPGSTPMRSKSCGCRRTALSPTSFARCGECCTIVPRS